MEKHDSDWTVSTLKAYFEALRTEDQRAIGLLSRDLTARLDRVANSLEALKTGFERLESSLGGGDKKQQIDRLLVFNVMTVILAVGSITAVLWYHH